MMFDSLFLTIRRRHKHFVAGAVAIVLVASLILNNAVFVRTTQAATHDFVQTNWGGGESGTPATHPTNKTSWTYYSSADSGITVANAGADLQLGTTASTTIVTDNGTTISGFNKSDASFSSTEVAGNSVKLTTGGASIWASTTVESTGTVGNSSVVTIGSDGFPRIGYIDASTNQLKLAICSNVSCSSYSSVVVTTQVQTDIAMSLATSTDLALFSYSTTDSKIMYTQCTNSTCSATSTAVTLGAGVYSDMALGNDGFAKVVYNDNNRAVYANCTNAACTGVATTTLNNINSAYAFIAVATSTGNPMIAYDYNSSDKIGYLNCSNVNCSATSSTQFILDDVLVTVFDIAQGSDGFAKVIGSHADDYGYGDLTYINCTNADCSASGQTIIYTNDLIDGNARVAIGSDGLPILAISNMNLQLDYWDCVNQACSSKTTKTLDGTSIDVNSPSIAIDSSGNVFITYYNTTNSDLKMAYQSTAYNSSGTYTSGSINIGLLPVSWGNISWTNSAGQTISIKARTDADGDFSNALDWDTQCSSITSGNAMSTGSCVDNSQQYIQFRATLSTDDLTTSPSLDDVTIGYNLYSTSSSLTSSAYDSASSANTIGGVAWTEDSSLPSGTGVTVSIRTASTSDGLSSANWLDYTNASSTCGNSSGTITCNSLTIPSYLKDGSNDEWFQYKVTLTSTGANTPTVGSVTITYVVNNAPEFDLSYGDSGGLRVYQNATTSDSTYGKVRIDYKIRDTDTSSGTYSYTVVPTFEYNTGSGWNTIATTTDMASGDGDPKTVAESDYNIYSAYWDAQTTLAGNYSTTAQIRVSLNDREGANYSTSTSSGYFTVDAKAPTISTFTLDSSADTLAITSSDDTNISYKLSNSSSVVADGTNAISGSWQAVGGTSTTTSVAWTPTGASFETVYMVTKDAFGNSVTSTAIAPYAPANIDIKDTSNAATAEYRLFVAWSVYSATTSATFARYEIYRSTDGTNYSQVSSTTNSALNYYSDSSLASTTTYYYKVRTVDSDGDISSYSSVVSDIPNGQGGTDNTAPAISSISIAQVQATWVKITWTTDEIATSRVDYSISPSTAFGSNASSSSYVTSHSQVISGLTPNTAYLFQIKSTDATGNTATDNNSGSGYATTTLDAPTITDVVTEAVYDRSAVITWNTNISSDSYVVMASSTANLISDVSTSETGDSTLIATSTDGYYQHRVTVSGLMSRKPYYFYVKSSDSSGNLATDTNGGNYYSFTTTYDRTAPVISSIATPVVTASTVVITWNTDELSDTQVLYGTSTDDLSSQTTLDSTMTISHASVISGLTGSTKYYYSVYSSDAADNIASSSVQNFTTSDSSNIITRTVYIASGGGSSSESDKDTQAPVISEIKTSNISAFGATISFKTSELSTGFILYGKDKNNLSNTSGDSEFKTSHDINLTGLQLGTTYYYKVKAIDKVGNAGTSAQGEFVTQFASEALKETIKLEDAAQFQDQLEGIIESVLPSLVPPFIGKIDISNISENSAKITWRTNVPSYGFVAFSASADYEAIGKNIYNSEIKEIAQKKDINHEVLLTGLSPATAYHYQIKSYVFPEVVGKTTDAIFVTKASKIKPEITKTGNTFFEVSWFSPNETSSFVEYKDVKTGKGGQVGDNTRLKNHLVKVENLIPDATYRVRSFGYDDNNTLVEGDILVVKTKKDITPPEITSIKIDNALLPGRSDRLQTVVSWRTNEIANSRVYYEEGIGTQAEFSHNTGQDDLTTDHIVIITNFKPSTVYRMQIVSTDESGNTTKSPMRSILTPRSAESILDVITRNLQDTFGFLNRLRQ